MSRLRSTYGRVTAGLVIVCVLALLPRAPACHAGNKQMVEQRTEQLGEINEQVVRQIPEPLPPDGQIDVTADVVQEQGETKIQIQDYAIQRGKILRNNQNQGGKQGEMSNRAIPRNDPGRH
jgi:hypothetical protein